MWRVYAPVANYFKDFAVAAVTLFIRECVPQLVRAYHKRYTEPKKAHRQVFLDKQAGFQNALTNSPLFIFSLAGSRYQTNLNWRD